MSSPPRPATLPPYLWAEIYTDFSLEVLDRKVSVQARQFSGLEPTTHGEAQRRFDSIFELLSALEARVAGGS